MNVRNARALTLTATLVATFLGGPTPPAAAADLPAVWVGSPVNGYWPRNAYVSGSWECVSTTQWPSARCSLPFAHHTTYAGDPYRGDWAADLQGVSTGTPVKVFAAPKNTALNLRARVDNVTYACAARSGETSAARLARGGHVVVVGFYVGTTKIGTAKYMHIRPATGIARGTWIPRWNKVIGYPGSYMRNSCWGGVHVHFEMTSWVHYACTTGVTTLGPAR
jgi:hypothetical protein